MNGEIAKFIYGNQRVSEALSYKALVVFKLNNQKYIVTF